MGSEPKVKSAMVPRKEPPPWKALSSVSKQGEAQAFFVKWPTAPGHREYRSSVVYFEEPYNFGTDEDESIIQGENIKSFTGHPVSSCIEGIKYLLNK